MYENISKYTVKNDYKAKPIVSGFKASIEHAEDVINPNNLEKVGIVINADAKVAKRL